MTDKELVARLRQVDRCLNVGVEGGYLPAGEMIHEAAAAIERLEAQVKQEKEANAHLEELFTEVIRDPRRVSDWSYVL